LPNEPAPAVCPNIQESISVLEKDVPLICDKLKSLNLKYKINECLKIDKEDYYFKGKIRKF
jgi:hypothetical protein